jgi:hypothetical protein
MLAGSVVVVIVSAFNGSSLSSSFAPRYINPLTCEVIRSPRKFWPVALFLDGASFSLRERRAPESKLASNMIVIFSDDGVPRIDRCL